MREPRAGLPHLVKEDPAELLAAVPPGWMRM